jgi:hypothetical protein
MVDFYELLYYEGSMHTASLDKMHPGSGPSVAFELNQIVSLIVSATPDNVHS